ncbi:TonB-dependent receptor [Sphingomonas sp. HF-S3]|uniref:TonB-dependent receptor n=1 Tax=Sphingomonas rustica TaxID=3103142 RepID=A0ABV0B9Y8_9SPHN
MSFRTVSAALAVLAAMPVAQAQTLAPEDGEDGIVVTASRTGSDPGTTIADRETIARRQPASLLEVLEDLAGVTAFSTGGPAGGSFLSIRGGEPNFTAVLIDGVRLNDPTNSAGGAFDFTLLDPSIVDRIEVSRTAGSAVHGSDALSGVVQIVTRDPGAAGVTAGGQAWLDTRSGGAASASLSGAWATGGVILSGGRYDSGDYRDEGSLRRNQFFAKAVQRVADFRISMTALRAETRGTRFPEDSGGPLLAVIRDRETRRGLLSLGALSLTRDPEAALRPSLSVAWTVQRGSSVSPPIAPGVLDGVPAVTARDRFGRLEAIGSVAGDLGPLTLSGGGAILREDGRSVGTLDYGFPLPVAFSVTRITHSGFAEATLRIPQGLQVGGAIRYDRLQGGSGNWTGRGSLSWTLAPSGLRLFAHLAHGYKRPSLYALGHPLIGNPALAPETSHSLDAGIEAALPAGRVSLTLFDNRFRDLIDFDPVQFRLVNRARVGTRGIEGALSLTLGGPWSLSGAITYLSLDSDTPLRGRPEWRGTLRLGWDKGPWRADATLRANSDWNDSSIPTGARVTPGHAEADIGVAYRLTDRVRLRLTARNLGDNRSWDAVGTPAPGRSGRLSISVE